MTLPLDARHYQLLYELGSAFAARLEIDELVPLVIGRCREAFEAESVAVMLLDEQRETLFFPCVTAEDSAVAERLLALRVPADRGIAGSVVHSGRAERVDDAAGDPRFYADIDRATGVTTRTLLGAPLTTHRGVIGVVSVVNCRDGKAFTDAHLTLLEMLAGSIAVAMENALLYGKAREAEQTLRVQVGALRRDLARLDRFTDIVSVAPAMRPVFRLMETAAASAISVLIEGETGTGKELVARGIHRASARADGPFIAVNCAAVPETLLERELFGHKRGTFTGAIQDHRGVFEAASGGTILLDEVGEMPPPMQAKLLRVLQEGEITPIGEHRPRAVDVRVIAATNRDLAAEVSAGRFREDLFYRLAVFPIQLPTLQERLEDIPLLAERFLQVAAERQRKQVPGIEPSAQERLMAFTWPGNVRELENEIERAVALCPDGQRIGIDHLSPKLLGAARVSPAARSATSETMALREARGIWEARYVRDVLRQLDGNVSRAARVLGLSRVMLQKKMKAYGLRS